MSMKKLSVLIGLLLLGLIPANAVNDGSKKVERNLVVEGNRLFNEDKFHEALEKYDEALALNPTYQYAMFNKAVTLVQLATDDNKGKENDPRKLASQLFADIAQLNTNEELSAKSFYNLGNMSFNDNEFDKAINMYKGSLRINPDNKQCRQNLLLALKKKQEQEQNQDKQDQDKQDKDEQQQQQQQQQEQQQQEQQQQQQQPQMTQSAEQLLQAMQNKENATRKKNNERQVQPARRSTDKPW